MNVRQRLFSSGPPPGAESDEKLWKVTTATGKDKARGRQDLATAESRNQHVLLRMNGSFMGEPVLLEQPRCVLGRAPDVDVWVGDIEMSRQHAAIHATAEGYELEDLGSANGTFVDGKRITRHTLQHGEIVQLGPNALFRYELVEREHYRLLVRMYEASVRDSMTGAYNRNYFAERMDAELAFARRHKSSLSLLMLDLDRFKRINDEHGHRVGDEVLVAVCRVAEENLRVEDVFVRYGGEEFAAILRDIPLAGAFIVAERLRSRIARSTIAIGERELRVTVSIGCASLACCAEHSVEVLVATADRRLYAAKRGGRNRVEASG